MYWSSTTPRTERPRPAPPSQHNPATSILSIQHGPKHHYARTALLVHREATPAPTHTEHHSRKAQQPNRAQCPHHHNSKRPVPPTIHSISTQPAYFTYNHPLAFMHHVTPLHSFTHSLIHSKESTPLPHFLTHSLAFKKKKMPAYVTVQPK